MIRILFVALGLGDLVGPVYYLAHHRTGLTGLVLTFGAWVAHRWNRRFKHTGRRVAPPEVQQALRAARRQARKAVPA